MKKYDIVGLGSCLVDYIAKVPKIIGAEEKVNVQSITRGFGGPTTNNLVQASRLGLSTVWVGQIGDDDNGKYIINSFSQENMDIDFIKIIPGAESSLTWIAVDPNGERAIYMSSNITSKITEKDVWENYRNVIRNARLFHSELCQLPLRPVIEGAEIARKAGVPVAIDYDVDVNIYIDRNRLGTRDELQKIISLTDIFKSGREIVLGMTECNNPEDAAKAILKQGPKMIAITLGAEGSILATKDELIHVPSITVKSVDSTGAGDAFMGGLGYGILQGWPLGKIGELANACGSFCCRKIGAQQVGTLDEIKEFMNENGI